MTFCLFLLSYSFIFLLFFIQTLLFSAIEIPFKEEIDKGNGDCNHDEELDIIAIFHDFIVELIFRYSRMQIPTEGCKDAVPCSGTDCCVEKELPRFHFR